jgi:hypothetical protein
MFESKNATLPSANYLGVSIMSKFKVRVSLPRNEWNQSKADLLMEACKFYAKEMMGARLANLLQVKIHVRKSVCRKRGKYVGGFVKMNPTGSKRQRKFVITLNGKFDMNTQLKMLSHEMIHVRQKAKDQMQWRWNEKNMCLMVRWMNNAPVKSDEIPYRERPWEVEAYKYQEHYYKMFIDQINIIKNKMEANNE